jgi:hypothetical protein
MADFPSAIEAAGRILEGERRPNQEVIIITDTQATAWRDQSPLISASLKVLRRNGEGPSVMVVQVSPPPAENAAVTAVVVEDELVTTSSPATLRVQVHNFGKDERIDLPVELRVDGTTVARKRVAVKPGGDAVVAFRHRFPVSGSHILEGAIREDYLPADDRHYEVVEVFSTIPVLLVEGRPGAERFRTATDFLAAALGPADPDSPGQRPLLDVQVVDYSHFSETDLSGVEAAALACVPGLTMEVRQGLKRFVRAGGGLLVLASGELSPGEFSVIFGEEGEGLVPAAMASPRDRALEEEPIRLELTARDHPALRVFEDETLSELLERVPIRKTAGGTDLLSPTARALADFSTGETALIENEYGTGRVIYFGSSADREAGDFPLNPAFVPFFRELVLYLVSPGRAGQRRKCGEPVEFTLSGKGTMTIIRPDGMSDPGEGFYQDHESGGGGRVLYPDTDKSGIYELQVVGRGGISRSLFASVNVPGPESVPEALSRRALEDTYRDTGIKAVGPEEDLQAALYGARFGSEMWPILLSLVILLVVLEAVLGRLFAPRAIDAEGMAREAGRL